METYLTLSFLNDFIFCPRSIYFHQLYSNFNTQLYKQKVQIEGSESHSAIDEKRYSDKINILQSIEVFSEKYNICGKIDVFDVASGKLTERKKEIKVIYDGYIYQVYAQCHALREMGYMVNDIVIHDLSHNKNYQINLPENDNEMQNKFEQIIEQINSFDIINYDAKPNKAKCIKCIYSSLCDITLC